MTSNKAKELSEWRMDRFHTTNQSDASEVTDFVCLSPSQFDKNDIDSNAVFVTDSDNDIIPCDTSTVDSNVKSPQLITVEKAKPTSSRQLRKRKKNVILCTNSSSDEGNLVEQTKRKRITQKTDRSSTKALPLKPMFAKRKTAVVVPITKSKLNSDINCDEPKSEFPAATPTKKSTNFALLDELLNSPVLKTPSKKLEKESDMKDDIQIVTLNNTPTKIVELEAEDLTSSPKAAVSSKPIDEILSKPTNLTTTQQSDQASKSQENECNSDSDISLFEVSFTPEEAVHSKSHGITSLDTVVPNPPPSPVDNVATTLPSFSIHDSPTYSFVPENPTEQGFSSDSSVDGHTRKRSSKGKQPANKRKKVLAKRSRPLSEEEELGVANAIEDSGPPVTNIDLTEVSVNEKDSSTPSVATSSGTSRSKEHVNKAIVRPSPVIVIADNEDDDDDVVMLSARERNRQEEDDLEFARRLQAQFDEENAIPSVMRGPDHIHAAPSSSAAPGAHATGSPLTNTSERLLQALGGSPAVSQFLASPLSARQMRNVPAELATVEQRLELLQQLALQQEYLDDATISEILGVSSDRMQATPTGTTSRGPRPTRGRGGARARLPYSPRRPGALQRVMQGAFGMEDPDEMSYEALLELSDRIGDVRRAGLSAEVIDLLPIRTYSADTSHSSAPLSTTCHICMSDFVTGDRLRTLNCFHEYHSACIDQWLKKSATCPICRVQVFAD